MIKPNKSVVILYQARGASLTNCRKSRKNDIANRHLSRKVLCCIFQPAFGCCALETLVEIVIFSIFCAKKAKKSKKFEAKFCKKHVFLGLHQNAGGPFSIGEKTYCYNKGSLDNWQLELTFCGISLCYLLTDIIEFSFTILGRLKLMIILLNTGANVWEVVQRLRPLSHHGRIKCLI